MVSIQNEVDMGMDMGIDTGMGMDTGTGMDMGMVTALIQVTMTNLNKLLSH